MFYLSFLSRSIKGSGKTVVHDLPDLVQWSSSSTLNISESELKGVLDLWDKAWTGVFAIPASPDTSSANAFSRSYSQNGIQSPSHRPVAAPTEIPSHPINAKLPPMSWKSSPPGSTASRAFSLLERAEHSSSTSGSLTDDLKSPGDISSISVRQGASSCDLAKSHSTSAIVTCVRLRGSSEAINALRAASVSQFSSASAGSLSAEQLSFGAEGSGVVSTPDAGLGLFGSSPSSSSHSSATAVPIRMGPSSAHRSAASSPRGSRGLAARIGTGSPSDRSPAASPSSFSSFMATCASPASPSRDKEVVARKSPAFGPGSSVGATAGYVTGGNVSESPAASGATTAVSSAAGSPPLPLSQSGSLLGTSTSRRIAAVSSALTQKLWSVSVGGGGGASQSSSPLQSPGASFTSPSSLASASCGNGSLLNQQQQQQQQQQNRLQLQQPAFPMNGRASPFSPSFGSLSQSFQPSSSQGIAIPCSGSGRQRSGTHAGSHSSSGSAYSGAQPVILTPYGQLSLRMSLTPGSSSGTTSPDVSMHGGSYVHPHPQSQSHGVPYPHHTSSSYHPPSSSAVPVGTSRLGWGAHSSRAAPTSSRGFGRPAVTYRDSKIHGSSCGIMSILQTPSDGALLGAMQEDGSVAAGTARSVGQHLRLFAGAHMMPHVDKVEKGGEDAYYISDVGLGSMGVADGVSGWADEGINPADYPRTLLRYAKLLYEEAEGQASTTDIIRYSQHRTHMKGSSTICLAVMKPNSKMEIANVGDSGVRVLRDGQVVFATESQQHAFNMPYQLGHPNNVMSPDSADDADVHIVDLCHGDLVLLATDGLYDNLFDEEIEDIVRHWSASSAPSSFLPHNAAVAVATDRLIAGALPEAVRASHAPSTVSSRVNLCATGVVSGSSNVTTARSSSITSSLHSMSGLSSAQLSQMSMTLSSAPFGNGTAIDELASLLTMAAHRNARNSTKKTPWSVSSSSQPNFPYAKYFANGGGKMDDCTVVIALVC